MISTFAKFLDATGLLRFAASAKRTRIAGGVDGLHRGRIRGWAINLDEPALRLIVQVMDDANEVIGEVLADRYRADVQKAGYGDGHHGFALSAATLGGIGKARFFCGSPLTELPRHTPAPAASAGRTFEQDGYMLRLDQMTAGPRLTGWAVDRNHPEERRSLRVRAGHQPLAEQRATLFRPDSLERGGDGFHGFSLPLPSGADHLFVEDLASGLEFRIP